MHKGAWSYHPMAILSPHLAPICPHLPPFFLAAFTNAHTPQSLVANQTLCFVLFSPQISIFPSSIQNFPHFPPVFLNRPNLRISAR